MSHTEFKRSNTQVILDPSGCAYLSLHRNCIAYHEPNGELKITNCGWSTVTTKDRLNALPSVHIQQRKGVWYLNGEEWDGEWITVISGTSPTVVDESKEEIE